MGILTWIKTKILRVKEPVVVVEESPTPVSVVEVVPAKPTKAKKEKTAKPRAPRAKKPKSKV